MQFFLVLLFYVSCKSEPKETFPLKYFSVFTIRIPDSIEVINYNLYQFNANSITKLEGAGLHLKQASIVYITPDMLDTLKFLINKINFKSLFENTKNKGDVELHYCGYEYGFIDSAENVGVLIPPKLSISQKETLKRFELILFNLKGKKLNDNIVEFSSMNKILTEYRKKIQVIGPPTLPTVKFTQPE